MDHLVQPHWIPLACKCQAKAQCPIMILEIRYSCNSNLDGLIFHSDPKLPWFLHPYLHLHYVLILWVFILKSIDFSKVLKNIWFKSAIFSDSTVRKLKKNFSKFIFFECPVPLKYEIWVRVFGNTNFSTSQTNRKISLHFFKYKPRQKKLWNMYE